MLRPLRSITVREHGGGLSFGSGAARSVAGPEAVLARLLELGALLRREDGLHGLEGRLVGGPGLFLRGVHGQRRLTHRQGIRIGGLQRLAKGPVGLAVAAGEAEIGVQQLCELAPVRGIDIVGPLPPPLQKLTYFSAGVTAQAKNPQAALGLIALLTSDVGRAAMRAGGMEPAAA